MTEEDDLSCGPRLPFTPLWFACLGYGGCKRITEAYKRDPSSENYLNLRKEYPDKEIEVSFCCGLDQLCYMESELARYGISAEEFCLVLDANNSAISRYSLFFLEKIAEAKSLAEAGETHLARRGLAVPDKLIDWFITCALEAMSYNNRLKMNRDLIMLIRERLGGTTSEYLLRYRVHEKKQNAALIGGQLKAQGVQPSLRRIAEHMHVNPTTLMRWFEPGELEGEVERYAKWFNQDGTLRWTMSKADVAAE
jgi:hypothetical protein